VVVVAVPGLGDDIQAIKAGILEIADVFVLNKADREGADRTYRDLATMLSLADALEWTPPILRTVAPKGEGDRGAPRRDRAPPRLDGGRGASSAAARAAAAARRGILKERCWPPRATKRASRARSSALTPSGVDPYRGADRFSAASSVPRAAAAERCSGRGENHEEERTMIASSTTSESRSPRSPRRAGSTRRSASPSRASRRCRRRGAGGHAVAAARRASSCSSRPPESPIARFLEKRGPGIHHLSDQRRRARRRRPPARRRRTSSLRGAPTRGAGGCWVQFVHPKSRRRRARGARRERRPPCGVAGPEGRIVSLGPGAIVTLHLVNPTEKLWGLLERLEPVGIVFRGISLDFFEEWVNELASGAGSTLGSSTMFVPLFRVEKIFLDEQVGEVESYQRRFARRTGLAAASVLGGADAGAGEPRPS
jgi:hypothetical protein